MSKAMWIITSNTKRLEFNTQIRKVLLLFFSDSILLFSKNWIADEFMEILLISMKFGKKGV